MARLGGSELASFDSPLDEDMVTASHGWPQEVRKLLFEANREASALRAERKTLLARAAQLERRLEAANARITELTEHVETLEREKRQPPKEVQQPHHQWLQDVTERTTSALRSGQEVAQSLVDRAQQRAAEIEQAAVRDAANIRKRAEARAAKVLSVAEYDAEGLLQGAQASAEELLSEAEKQRQQIAAALRQREEVLHAEIERLETRRLQLLQTCAAIRRPVDEAMRLLEQGADNGARPVTNAPLMARLRGAYATSAKRATRRPPSQGGTD